MEEYLEAAEQDAVPMLPLRGITVFPGMLISVDVERAVSVAALNAALSGDQKVCLVAQKDISVDLPEQDDLYRVGTVCTVKQILRIPGTNFVKIMVEGICRARLSEIVSFLPYFTARYEEIEETALKSVSNRTELLIRRCVNLFDDYAGNSGTVTPETVLAVAESEDPGHLADYVTQNVFLRHTEKQ